MRCQDVREEAAVALLRGDDPSDGVRAHVDGCDECRVEIEDLRPLPPLLRLASPVSAAAPDDMMLRRVLASASRERRSRRRWALLTAAVALVALVLPVGWLVSENLSGPTAAPPVAGSALRLSGTDPTSGVVGVVQLKPSTLGSELTMSVRGVTPGTRCALVVVDESGAASRVTVWDADYRGTAEVGGQASTPVAEIELVELRDVGTGTVLWSAPVPT